MVSCVIFTVHTGQNRGFCRGFLWRHTDRNARIVRKAVQNLAPKIGFTVRLCRMSYVSTSKRNGIDFKFEINKNKRPTTSRTRLNKLDSRDVIYNYDKTYWGNTCNTFDTLLPFCMKRLIYRNNSLETFTCRFQQYSFSFHT